MAIDAARVIADLRELAQRTGDERGAQRVAWGETWRAGRAFVAELLAELEIEPERDEAGNVWARLDGSDPGAPAIVVGSHVDSVPDGGWLDGALGVLAGLGALRARKATAAPARRSLLLVDWADEEGARFGRSLLGSSAFSGTLEPAAIRDLRDPDGVRLEQALAENGVEVDRMLEARSRASALAGYLELHIEQGPVLEREGLAVAAVSGCAGVERLRLHFRGQAAHAGTTPMTDRRDAGLAAAATALAIERIAAQNGGVGTTGVLAMRPGIISAVPGEAALDCDLRHADAEALGAMFDSVREAGADEAAHRNCEMIEEQVWRIEPIPFDQRLVDLATEAAQAAGGRAEPLASGALHDAAEIARVIPAAMMFCSSLRGLSHTPDEDTDEADLHTAIEAFGDLVERALASD